MAKSSTPDEMLNALLTGIYISVIKILVFFLQGKTDGITNKENQQSTSLRTVINGWNEPSLFNKKSTSGLNLRQQKDSPFNEVNSKIFFSEYFLYVNNRIVIPLLRNLRLY
jgi:hypothetical protein